MMIAIIKIEKIASTLFLAAVLSKHQWDQVEHLGPGR